MKVYKREDPVPVGTAIKIETLSSKGRKSTDSYLVSEIYRTYNTGRELVKITYNLSPVRSGASMHGVLHEKLLSYMAAERKAKK